MKILWVCQGGHKFNEFWSISVTFCKANLQEGWGDAAASLPSPAHTSVHAKLMPTYLPSPCHGGAKPSPSWQVGMLRHHHTYRCPIKPWWKPLTWLRLSNSAVTTVWFKMSPIRVATERGCKWWYNYSKCYESERIWITPECNCLKANQTWLTPFLYFLILCTINLALMQGWEPAVTLDV